MEFRPGAPSEVNVLNWDEIQAFMSAAMIASAPSVQAVTGVFWQATQPVSVASLPSLAQTFARIKAKQFASTEEVRYDIPASLVSADIYTGVNTDATATSTATWTVIRSYFDANGNPARERIKSGISWDNRAAAGNWT